MIKIQVPMFDEFDNYKFLKFEEIELKDKIDSLDYNKVTCLLPGIPQGYCPELYEIAKTKKPIEIIDFYDIRQNKKALKKLKNYFIKVIE